MAAPIVRGQCDACGYSRNLWVSELLRFGSTGVPCDHGEEHGCAGYLLTVYKGPKAWIPESCYQPCSCVREGRGERAGAASQDRGSPGYLEPEAAPEAFPALLNLSEASLRELEASVVLVDDFLLKEAPVVAQAATSSDQGVCVCACVCT